MLGLILFIDHTSIDISFDYTYGTRIIANRDDVKRIYWSMSLEAFHYSSTASRFIAAGNGKMSVNSPMFPGGCNRYNKLSLRTYPKIGESIY